MIHISIECPYGYPHSKDIFEIIMNKYSKSSSELNESIKHTFNLWKNEKLKYKSYNGTIMWVLEHHLAEPDLQLIKKIIFEQLREFYIESLIMNGSVY